MKPFSLLLVAFFTTHCHAPVKQPAALLPKAASADTTPKNNAMDAASNALRQLKEQLDAGIDFTASGHKPFWLLEIDFSKQLHFKNVSGFEIKTPVPEAAQAMDANVTRYRAVTEGGELIVQIAQQQCTNSISGATFDYTVTVDTKRAAETDYTSYKGCGSYTYDYRLNDIWVLERINNNILKSEDFMKNLPQLELNLAQKKVFGHTGCNNLSGAMEVQGKQIRFGMLLTTKMACPTMDFENRYISNLQQRTIPYKIESGKLQLQVAADTAYTYRKID